MKTVLIGMVHLLPTMSYDEWSGMEEMLDKALKDLKALQDGGADGALIENDGDHPCQVLGVSDVVVPITVVARELSKVSKIPLGVEVLLNDPKASLAIAKTCNLFIVVSPSFRAGTLMMRSNESVSFGFKTTRKYASMSLTSFLA